jgi:hypothetical protein
MQQKMVCYSKKLYEWSKNVSQKKSQNCFREAKKPLFCFIVAKNGLNQDRVDLVADLTGDVRAVFLGTIEAS